MANECSMEEARDRVMKEVEGHFPPEFRSRFDQTVVFDPLSPDQLKEVARLQANDVTRRLAAEGITLNFSDAALAFALARSYAPVYGAQPTRRWFGQNVVTKLLAMLARDEIREGSTVYIDAGSNAA